MIEKQWPRDVFPSCQPVLEVRDVQAAIDQYRDRLGFDLDFSVGSPPHYACVGRLFCPRAAAAFIRFSRCDEVVTSGWLSIYVEPGLDALYEEYTSRGVEVSWEIGDRDWGMREFEIRDLNGHRLRFGTVIHDSE